MSSDLGKRCSRCLRWLPVWEFRANPELRSGLDSQCKSCHAEATRAWRAANPDYIAGYNATRRSQYREQHPRTPRACVVCGDEFVGSPVRLVCSERCRNRRRYAQRKAKAAA